MAAGPVQEQDGYSVKQEDGEDGALRQDPTDPDVEHEAAGEEVMNGYEGHAEEDLNHDEQPMASTSTAVPSSLPRRPRPTKRKYSPSSHPATAAGTPTARSPAPTPDLSDSFVAPLPHFAPHNCNLPTSNFEFWSTSKSHPSNKQNYRYTPCGPSTTNTLPIQIHRTIESMPQNVRFSWEDRSPFVLITEDARTITTDKGWRAARVNVPVREGNWYWEVKVDRAGGEGGRETGGVGEGSWCRVGVGRRESPLNAPVGFDGHSYAYRDRHGDAVNLSRPRPFGKKYGSHSTIGVYISLPARPTPPAEDRRDPARIVRKRVPIRYKGQLYFESLEYAANKEMEDLSIDPASKAKVVVEEKKAAAPGTKARPAVEDLGPPPRPLPKLEKSRVAFFLDGECQGVAYEDLYDFVPLRLHPGGLAKKSDPRENWHDDGMMGYFPFVSVFGGAIATLNPGPDFEFPPPPNIEAALSASPNPPTSSPLPTVLKDGEERAWQPLSERYVEYLAEQSILDDLDEQESIRVYHAAKLVEEEERARRLANPLKAATTAPLPPSKKGKLAGQPPKLLADLGAVKNEDVVSVGSPAPSNPASPVPFQMVSFHPAPMSRGATPSALRDEVPETSDEEEEDAPLAEVEVKEETPSGDCLMGDSGGAA